MQVDQRGAARLANLEGRSEGGEGGEEGKSDGEELLGGGTRWDVSGGLAGGKPEWAGLTEMNMVASGSVVEGVGEMGVNV